MSEDIEVRELKAKDLKTLIKLFGKLSPQSKGDLMYLVKGASEEESPDLTALGAKVFQVLPELTDDLYAWLADMCNMSVQELDDKPIGTPIEIVKVIFSRAEVKDFFERAVQESTS